MRSPLERRQFEQTLRKLHVELVKLQFWARHKGLKVVVVFEGRDASATWKSPPVEATEAKRP
jgi:polyphosphate kinase 2 (PPK2 family)